jgi:hypothetical protein
MFSSFDRHVTGMPVLDAQADFRRARRAQFVARIGRWLIRRGTGPNTPRTMADVVALGGGPARLQVVPLDSIVGTLEPTVHFDARFRPVSDVVRARWERIALAHRRGIALPPIQLRSRGDGHYVIDGRHRVSVALALGHRDIDAWVTSDRTPVGSTGGSVHEAVDRSACRACLRQRPGAIPA